MTKRGRFSKYAEKEKQIKFIQPKKEKTSKSFISRIALSLSECGYKINSTVILFIFIIYLLVFFFIGFSFLGPTFRNVSPDVTTDTIINDSKFSSIKKDLINVGIISTGIRTNFYNNLKSNQLITSYFGNHFGDFRLGRDPAEENMETIKDIVYSNALTLTTSTFHLEESSLPPFNPDLLSTYRSIKQDTSISNKKIAFLNAATTQFIEYLSLPPFDKLLVEIADIVKQQFLFKLSFGIIIAFEAYLIFLSFIEKPLSEMSLNRIKSQIPGWLQMMTNSIQAGNSLLQALQFSQKRITTPPLSYVLDDITTRYETYKNLEQALSPLSKWSEEIPELKNLTSSLIIQEKTGGNLIPVLYAINDLFKKKIIVSQKIDSVASEATGQLRIIFVMFFGIILIMEIFMKSFNSPLSPVYMFYSRGGNFAGFFYLTFIHMLILFMSFALYKGGEIIVANEMKF